MTSNLLISPDSFPPKVPLPAGPALPPLPQVRLQAVQRGVQLVHGRVVGPLGAREAWPRGGARVVVVMIVIVIVLASRNDCMIPWRITTHHCFGEFESRSF